MAEYFCVFHGEGLWGRRWEKNWVEFSVCRVRIFGLPHFWDFVKHPTGGSPEIRIHILFLLRKQGNGSALFLTCSPGAFGSFRHTQCFSFIVHFLTFLLYIYLFLPCSSFHFSPSNITQFIFISFEGIQRSLTGFWGRGLGHGVGASL